MILNFRKIISCSLSPNTQSPDFWQTIKVLLTPWTWKKGKTLWQVEQWFCQYFNIDQVVLFNSGRSALLAILKTFDISSGDEVLLQAFTCVAVPNSVLWVGAKPIFVDIDETFNLDADDVFKKITPRTKAIIIQHTFGVPAKMDKLIALVKKYKLILIEDCAHSLGASYQGRKVGTLGDAAFFSFGRDKVISSVWGGAGIISRQSKASSQKLKEYQKSLKYPSNFWILQQLLHPLIFSIILPLYNLNIGKLILIIFQKLKLVSIPVYPEEKRGLKPADFPAKYSNALAQILLPQLKKLKHCNQARRGAATYYHRVLKSKGLKFPAYVPRAVYLRFPVLTRKPQRLMKKAKQAGILLGDWYHNVIDPVGVNYEILNYKENSCPKATAVAKRIVNLPTTNLTQKQLERITKLFYETNS